MKSLQLSLAFACRSLVYIKTNHNSLPVEATSKSINLKKRDGQSKHFHSIFKGTLSKLYANFAFQDFYKNYKNSSKISPCVHSFKKVILLSVNFFIIALISKSFQDLFVLRPLSRPLSQDLVEKPHIRVE
jgi:hypothetical protein